MRAATLLALLLASSPAAAQKLVKVAAPNMGAQCDDLDTAPLAVGLDRQAALFARKSGSLRLGEQTISYADYAKKTLTPLAALARKGAKAMCAELPQRFDFYRNAGVGAGHFTVYYHPILRASRTKKGPYQYPLYKRPAGALAKLTTAEIIAGGLDGQGLELFYLADATEANAIHVEGSATLYLDDGKYTYVGTDGHNGHPYQNVGKLLVADKKIPKGQVTPLGMTRARKYFQDNPSELWKYWARNPHFVFFREKTVGASGRMGELTAGRSLAVDPDHVPLGAAVWFRSERPTFKDNKVEKYWWFGRVGMAQDTGSGIKGAGRVDMFFGSGEYAQACAQIVGKPGEVYVLLAK